MSSLLDRINNGGERAAWVRAHLDFPHKDWCLIWPFARSDTGYAIFGAPPRKVHRLMCEYRHGPAPTPEHHAAHSCDRGHDGCVNPWHLDWKTASDNQYDRHKDGVQRPRWKLTPEQAKEIRELKGLEHTKDTAARYGIRESNVRLIQSGKTWKKDRFDFRQWTDDEIKRIRSVPRGVKGLVKALAKEFGVTDSTIYRIKNSEMYRHLDETSSQLTRPQSQRDETSPAHPSDQRQGGGDAA